MGGMYFMLKTLLYLQKLAAAIFLKIEKKVFLLFAEV
jgi:hypothetical protein